MDHEELKKELEEILRSYYDDDGFVNGTIICLKTPENWDTMLRFIKTANDVGDVLTHDDLLALSLVIERRSKGLPRLAE